MRPTLSDHGPSVQALPADASPPAAHLASRTYGRAEATAKPDWDLVEQYLPLVKSIVGRMRIYFPSHIDIRDIYSIAVTGLISAIQRRDPERERSFSSFAALRVKGAILDELRRLDFMPRADRVRTKKYRREVDQLEQELGRPAEKDEIRKRLGLSKREHAFLLEHMRPVTLVSLDRQADSGQVDGGSVHDLVTDDTELDARERCEKRETVQLMRDRINDLPEMPRKVLMMYYYEGMRLAEIAAVFGLTESRICQIHSQAILSLRAYLHRMAEK